MGLNVFLWRVKKNLVDPEHLAYYSEHKHNICDLA